MASKSVLSMTFKFIWKPPWSKYMSMAKFHCQPVDLTHLILGIMELHPQASLLVLGSPLWMTQR